MINTRFVVSFLLFYTKIWFHLFCAERRGFFLGNFFVFSGVWGFHFPHGVVENVNGVV